MASQRVDAGKHRFNVAASQTREKKIRFSSDFFSPASLLPSSSPIDRPLSPLSFLCPPKGGNLPVPQPWPAMARGVWGLGLAAISYVAVDYLRYVSPSWHERMQPALWGVLALSAALRAPFYRHWPLELRAAIPFLASLAFMLAALLCEAFSVRFVTAVLGLDWHRYNHSVDLKLHRFVCFDFEHIFW